MGMQMLGGGDDMLSKIEGKEEHVHIMLRVGDVRISHCIDTRLLFPELRAMKTERQLRRYLEQKKRDFMKQTTVVESELHLALHAMMPQIIDEYIKDKQEVVKEFNRRHGGGREQQCPHCKCRWWGLVQDHSPGCPRDKVGK